METKDQPEGTDAAEPALETPEPSSADLAQNYIRAVEILLARPFDQVRWRIGPTNRRKESSDPPTKGIALAYVDARDVYNRLDEVVGRGGWKSELTVEGDAYISTISLWLPMPNDIEQWHWVSKSDAAGKTDIEAEKGGASDAHKRACVQWGIARYLYDLPAPWVELTADGRSIHPKEMEKIQALLRDGKTEAAEEPGSGPTPEEPPAETSPPATAPPGKDPEAKIDAAEQKKLWKANFAALRKVGFNDKQIETMESGEKFAPMSFAVEKLGKKNVKQVTYGEVIRVLHFLDVWATENWDERQR